MNLPTIAQAEALLTEGEQMNPGLWVEHSRSTGVNARIIAVRCAGLDPDAAYIMGLLHDIGRREGFSYIKHTWDGYQFMKGHGWEDVAEICLTHSFPVPDMGTFLGRIDIADIEYEFIREFVERREYTEYDRLIQLCDALSLPGGGVLIEKRLLDVAMRYGLNDLALDKWRATLELKRRFDELAGVDIYRLLPRIVETTFDW